MAQIKVTIRLDKNTYNKFKSKCREEGLIISKQIENLIINHLNKLF